MRLAVQIFISSRMMHSILLVFSFNFYCLCYNRNRCNVVAGIVKVFKRVYSLKQVLEIKRFKGKSKSPSRIKAYAKNFSWFGFWAIFWKTKIYPLKFFTATWFIFDVMLCCIDCCLQSCLV